jgi:hypothetical protein
MRIHVFLGVTLGFVAGVPLSAQVAVARFAEPGLKYELRVNSYRHGYSRAERGSSALGWYADTVRQSRANRDRKEVCSHH